jgi:hypothetical protein
MESREISSPRRATRVVENPHNLVATPFGVPEDDLTKDIPPPDVAIYDSGFVAIPQAVDCLGSQTPRGAGKRLSLPFIALLPPRRRLPCLS